MPENIPTLRDFYEVLKKQPEPDAANIVLELEIYIEATYPSLQTIQMLIPISVFWFTTSEIWANSSVLLGWLW